MEENCPLGLQDCLGSAHCSMTEAKPHSPILLCSGSACQLFYRSQRPRQERRLCAHLITFQSNLSGFNLAAPIYCVNPSSHTLLFRMPIDSPISCFHVHLFNINFTRLLVVSMKCAPRQHTRT